MPVSCFSPFPCVVGLMCWTSFFNQMNLLPVAFVECVYALVKLICFLTALSHFFALIPHCSFAQAKRVWRLCLMMLWQGCLYGPLYATYLDVQLHVIRGTAWAITVPTPISRSFGLVRAWIWWDSGSSIWWSPSVEDIFTSNVLRRLCRIGITYSQFRVLSNPNWGPWLPMNFWKIMT